MRDTISGIALIIAVLIVIVGLVLFFWEHLVVLLMGLVYFGLWAGFVYLSWQIGGVGLAVLAAIAYPVLGGFILERLER